MMIRWRNWGIAALITVLLAWGIGLRSTGLQDYGLWPDELYSADFILNRPLIPPVGTPWLEWSAFRDFRGTKSFWTVKATHQTPPLFELTGKAFTTLLGHSETALRMPSVVAGVLFLLWLAVRVWRYRNDAAGMAYLCALGMAALSGPLVYYAKEARVYSLAAALCGVLTVKFWERWRQGWRAAPLPGWGEALLFAAVAWAHYSALALAAPMWLAYAWEALRRRKRRAWAGLALMPLALLVWLTLSWRGFHESVQGHAGWMAPGGYDQTLHNLIHGLSYDVILLHGWPGWVWVLTLLAVGLAWWKIRHGLAPGLASPEHTTATSLARASVAVLLLCAVFLPLVAAIVVASRIFHPRLMLFMLPALYLGAGGLLALIRLRWRLLAWLLLALVLAAQYPLLQHNLALGKPVDIRTPAMFVRTHLQAGDPVLVTALDNPGVMRYYLTQWRVIDFDYDAGAPVRLCRELAHTSRFGVVTVTNQEIALRSACGVDYDIESISTAAPPSSVTGAVWRRKPSASAIQASSTKPVP